VRAVKPKQSSHPPLSRYQRHNGGQAARHLIL
jgi:hypothetical protein